MELAFNSRSSTSIKRAEVPTSPSHPEGKASRSTSDVSASTLSALVTTAHLSRGYPYCSPSYDPLAAGGRGVEFILQKGLLYEEDHDIVYCFEVREGKGLHCSLTPSDIQNIPKVVVIFPFWRTIPQDKIFLSSVFFLDILTRCEVNPSFIHSLSLPSVGAAGHSMTHAEGKLHSFHVCIRYPHTYPEVECALYLGYSFVTKRTVVLFLEGHGIVISRVGQILQELADHTAPMPQHPFSYLIPFITEMGRAMDHLRTKERDEVGFIEKSTDTGEIDPFQAGARNIENITHLTRLAHLRSASTARLQKLVRFHVRAVHELIKAFLKYQEMMAPTATEQMLREGDRLARILDQELDICQGRTMETENLVKRSDLQINVLISLAAQKDSQINKRIAEQSKNIAFETRRDSESMKTIAVLTMVFLPGTFVSAVLGMNVFDSSTGIFVVDSKWWLFPAITIPLTLLVVGCWIGWYYWKKSRNVDDRDGTDTESSDSLRERG